MNLKRFVERYLDTIVYILMALCLATLVVTTVELKKEVQAMENSICELREEIEKDILVENDDDGSLLGDDTEAQYPRLYTDEDAIALAKLAWGEARGVPVLEINGESVSTRTQQAAVMWTVLNRFAEGYEDSIIGVITAPSQFHGYSEEHPVDDELLYIAYDVLDRWNCEKHGETDIFRELPREYLWFHGDGTWNWFRDAYTNGNVWDWSV